MFSLFYVLKPKPRQSETPRTHERMPSRLHVLKCLRDELTLHGDAAEYVARLALVLLTSTAIYRYYHVRNGY